MPVFVLLYGVLFYCCEAIFVLLHDETFTVLVLANLVCIGTWFNFASINGKTIKYKTIDLALKVEFSIDFIVPKLTSFYTAFISCLTLGGWPISSNSEKHGSNCLVFSKIDVSKEDVFFGMAFFQIFHALFRYLFEYAKSILSFLPGIIFFLREFNFQVIFLPAGFLKKISFFLLWRCQYWIKEIFFPTANFVHLFRFNNDVDEVCQKSF